MVLKTLARVLRRLGVWEPLVNVLEWSWVDFRSFWGVVWETLLLIFYWFLYYFQDNDVFEEGRCQRAILVQKRAKNDPKMVPKTTPTGTKNETNMTSKI